MQPAGSLGIPGDLLAQERKSPDLSPRQDCGISKQEDSQGALDPGPLMSYPVTQAAQSRGPDSRHLADLKGVPASVPKVETMMGFFAACTKGQFAVCGLFLGTGKVWGSNAKVQLLSPTCH